MQDAARHKHRGIQWKCGFCDKIFRTEAFLDQHMDKNHQNEKHPVSLLLPSAKCTASSSGADALYSPEQIRQLTLSLSGHLMYLAPMRIKPLSHA